MRRVLGLVEAERCSEDDVEGGHIVPVAARVPILGLLVVLAATRLSTWGGREINTNLRTVCTQIFG